MSKELAKAKTPENNDKANNMKAVMDKVDKLSNVIGFLQRKLETMFGEDFNGDGKIGGARVALLTGIAILGFAVTSLALSPLNQTNTKFVITGDTDTDVIFDVDYSGNVRSAGTVSGVTGLEGTSSASTVTAVQEAYGNVTKTVLTLVDTELLITAGATTNAWGGVKIYDFPEGRILVHGVTVNGVDIECQTNVLPLASGGDFSFGTVTAASNVLTGTMVDLCPSTSIDTMTNVVNSALSASAQFDGTSTAKDMYLNFGIDQLDHVESSVSTNTVDAVVTITWSDLGDY